MKRVAVATAVAFMLGSGVAHAGAGDVPDTAYTGHYFMLRPSEPLRKCIVHRESRNDPTATSRGNHQGLYQMTDELADGASWMMRLDPIDPISKAERLWLERTPVKQWPRYWQDRAFYTVLNYLGANSGAKHWFLAGSPCGRLVYR